MEAPRARRPEPQEPVRALPTPPVTAQPTDVRSATPPIFRGSHLAPVARRLTSIAVLAAIDAVGITVGLYVSLVLREVYYGRSLRWGSLWQAETDWLPFLILVTLLVFAQGDLYAERERRPGIGRIVSSLLLVVLVTLAELGVGKDHLVDAVGGEDARKRLHVTEERQVDSVRLGRQRSDELVVDAATLPPEHLVQVSQMGAGSDK